MTEHRPDDEPFDELIAALRSGPRSDELAGEVAGVEAMVSALPSPEVAPVIRLRSRTPRIVGIVAASVVAISGLAAAGSGTFLPPSSNATFEQAPPASRPPFETPRGAVRSSTASTSTTSTSSTTTSTTVTSTTVTSTLLAEELVSGPETTGSLVDDPATAFDETQCAEGNHGRTVSSVAHSVEPGPDHGSAVSEAARSSCGKDVVTTATDDPDEAAEGDISSDATVASDSGGAKPPVKEKDHAPSDKGGRGNGRGRGATNADD